MNYENLHKLIDRYEENIYYLNDSHNDENLSGMLFSASKTFGFLQRQKVWLFQSCSTERSRVLLY